MHCADDIRRVRKASRVACACARPSVIMMIMRRTVLFVFFLCGAWASCEVLAFSDTDRARLYVQCGILLIVSSHSVYEMQCFFFMMSVLCQEESAVSKPQRASEACGRPRTEHLTRHGRVRVTCDIRSCIGYSRVDTHYECLAP